MTTGLRSWATHAVVDRQRSGTSAGGVKPAQDLTVKQPSVPRPAWIQRCGIGSSCGCEPRDKLAGVRRDLQQVTSGGGGTALPDTTRGQMEEAFSADFSAVQVHTGPAAHELASTLQAHALTTGSDIVFQAGGYRPGTPSGDRLLAHELAHVVQQGHGLPRASLDGGPTDPLEQAADRAAEAATAPAVGRNDDAGFPLIPGRSSEEPIQRKRLESTALGCPGYGRGEVARSRTADGILPSDVILRGPGALLIADFGVGRSMVKDAAKKDPLLLSFFHDFENDQGYRLNVLGLDDCVGSPGTRERLRRDRAMRVLDLLGPRARTRVEFAGAATLDHYTISYSSSGGRAMNRGVLVMFHRDIEGKPIAVRGTRPRENAPTSGCTAGEKSEIDRALPVAKAMVGRAIRAVSGTSDAAVRAMLRKYFNDDSDNTRGAVRAGLRKVLSGLEWGVTYECERPGSWFYEHFCGHPTTAYVRKWVGFRVHLCDGAFGRPTDHLAETLIHENSHMFDFTDDEEYCSLVDGCSPDLDTEDALDNADSYSSFAWDVAQHL